MIRLDRHEFITRLCSSHTTVRVLPLLVILTASALPAHANFKLEQLLFEPSLLATSSSAPELAVATGANPTLESNAAPAQSGTLLSDITAYNASIAELLESGGPFDPALIQQYFALGQAYQALGQHENAIEALEEAEYIARINQGLNTPEVFSLIKATIQSHQAMGAQASANEKRQYLLYLSQEYYGSGSLDLVPLLSDLGDWHMDSFNNTITADLPPVLSFTRTDGFAPRRPSASPRQMAFGNLYRAQNMYYQAINNLINNRVLYAPELLQLEQRLVETVFLAANREGFLRDPDFFLTRYRTTTGSRLRRSEFSGLSNSYINGRNAYQRMRIYLEYQSDISIQDKAKIMIAQADWNLLYSHHAHALRLYREAHGFMQEAGLPQETINTLLNPVIPVQLPTFTALPHSRAHLGLQEAVPVDYAGYLDVSFEISKYGKAKNITVLARSESAEKAVEERLKRLLKSTPFRPRIAQEASGSGSDELHQLRYYFAEVAEESGKS